MKDLLTIIAINLVTIIQIMALLVVAYGTIQAFVHSLRAMVNPSATGHRFQLGYIQYARWLIAGLTFQIAADVIETSIAPTWEEIGRLGAIAVIRTFLNFFLERDLAEVQQREIESQGAVDKSS